MEVEWKSNLLTEQKSKIFVQPITMIYLFISMLVLHMIM